MLLKEGRTVEFGDDGLRIPKKVLTKYHEMGIREIFAWQANCLALDGVLDLTKNLIYSAPTSAGKTMVSELIILKHVVETKKKVFFILPYVSVSREKMLYLKDLFSSLKAKVGGFMGGISPKHGLKGIRVALCTIEKANGLLNRMIETGCVDDLGLIVIDELHMIGDQSRGFLWELFLTKILYFNKRNQGTLVPETSVDTDGESNLIQIVGMSATLPNLDLIAKWLDAHVFISEFRPIPLNEMVYVHSKKNDTPQLFHINQENKKELIKRDFDDIVSNRSDLGNSEEGLISLTLETVIKGHGVLIFAQSRQRCQNIAIKLASEIESRLKADSENEIKSKLKSVIDLEKLSDAGRKLKASPTGLDPDILRTLRFAISFHHSALTIEEREIIEHSFREGAIKILVATTTLSSGVNLPARRVIIRTFAFPPTGLDFYTYKQMAGRAGRKNVDTAGESILMCSQEELVRVRQMFSQGLKPVHSCLIKSITCLRRAILEVIANGFIGKLSQAKDYIYGTLMYQEIIRDSSTNQSLGDNSIDGISQIDSSIPYETNALLNAADYRRYLYQSLNWLRKLKAITIEKVENTRDRILKVTPLGRALISSSLGPIDGINTFKELSKARQAISLESDLHLVYLVTPVNIETGGDISWDIFSRIMAKLSDAELNVAKLIGVDQSYVFRRNAGIRNKRDDKKNNEASYKRFYVAYILNQLIQEKSLQELVKLSGFNKGQLQSFQQRTCLYAGMVTTFCNRLGWVHLERLFAGFQWRLCFGASQELIDLLRLEPILNAKRARGLYAGGITSILSLSRANKNSITRLLQQSKQYDENNAETSNKDSIDLIILEDGRIIDEFEASELLIERSKEILALDLAAEYGVEIADINMKTNEQTTTMSETKSNHSISSSKDSISQPRADSTVSEESAYSPLSTSDKSENGDKQPDKLDEQFIPEDSIELLGDDISLNAQQKSLLKADQTNRPPSIENSKLTPPDCMSDKTPNSGQSSSVNDLKFSFMDDEIAQVDLDDISNQSSQRDVIAHETGQKSLHEMEFEDLEIDDFLKAEFTQEPSKKNSQDIISSISAAVNKEAASESCKKRKRFRLSIESLAEEEESRSPKKKLIHPFNISDSLREFAQYEFSTPIHGENPFSDSPIVKRKPDRKNTKSECSLFSDESALFDVDLDNIQPDKTRANDYKLNYVVVNSKRNNYPKIFSKLLASLYPAYQLTVLFVFEDASFEGNMSNPDLIWYGGPAGSPCCGGGRDSKIMITLKSIVLNITEFASKESQFNFNITLEVNEKDDPILHLFHELLDKSFRIITVDVKWSLRIINEMLIRNSKEAERFKKNVKKFTSPNLLWWTHDPDSGFASNLRAIIMKEFSKNPYYLKCLDYLNKLGHNSEIITQSQSWGKYLSLEVYETVKDSSDDDLQRIAESDPSKRKLRPTNTHLWAIGLTTKEAPCPNYLLVDSHYERHINPIMCSLITRLNHDLEVLLHNHLSSIPLEVETLWNIGLMEAKGFAIMFDVLQRCQNRIKKSIKVIQEIAAKFAGTKMNLSSPAEIADVLFNKLKLPNVEASAKTNTYQASLHAKNNNMILKSARELTSKGDNKKHPSTKKENLMLIAHFHPLPRLINEWRHLTHLLEKSFNGIINECNIISRRPCNESKQKIYRISCIYENYSATGRLNSSHPNLQCVPKVLTIDWPMLKKRPEPLKPLTTDSEAMNREWAPSIAAILEKGLPSNETLIRPRSAFTVEDPSKSILIGADFSQLELRILAHMSNDKDLTSLLLNPHSNKDAFRVLASHWFKIKAVDEVTDADRNKAKQLCYGLIYGKTAYTIAADLNIELDEAEEMISSFLETFEQLATYITTVVNDAKSCGYVKTINGRYRQIDPFKRALASETVKPSELAQGERQSINSTIQGSAADISKMALVLIMRKFVESAPTNFTIFPLLHIHDELIFEVEPKEMAQEIAEQIAETMSMVNQVFNIKIPMPVKVKVGDDWEKLK